MGKQNEESIRQICERYKSGEGTVEIAKSLGCTRRTVRLHLIKAGTFNGRKVLSDEEVGAIFRLFEHGEPIIGIARKLRIGEKWVRRILVENGKHVVGERAWGEDDKKRCGQLYVAGQNVASIARKLNTSQPNVQYQLHKSGLWKYKGTRKYRCNYQYFKSIDDERKAYWLGFIAADGNVFGGTLHIGVHVKDAEHLKVFRDDIKANYPVRIKEYVSKGKKSKIARIDIYSKELVLYLAGVGIHPNKTPTLEWESIVRHMDTELIRHFYRGFSDGDGSWTFSSRRSPKWCTVCHSKLFMDGMLSWLNNALESKMCPYFHNNSWRIDVAGWKRCEMIFDLMYKDVNVLLPRKVERAKEVLNYRMPGTRI